MQYHYDDDKLKFIKGQNLFATNVNFMNNLLKVIDYTVNVKRIQIAAVN